MTVQSIFTLLVEKTHREEGENGVLLMGTVHDKIFKGQQAYLYMSGKEAMQITVEEITIEKEGSVDEAMDLPVTVKISGDNLPAVIPAFSALSGLIPQPEVDVKKAIENPYLLALSREYMRFVKTEDYLEALVGELRKARFLVPVMMVGQPMTRNGKTTLPKGAKMSFPSLSSPEEKDKKVFPVFTDWRAVFNWKQLYAGKKKPQTVMFSMEDAAAMLKNGHEAVVINPFGPVSIYLPKGLVEKIVANKSK